MIIIAIISLKKKEHRKCNNEIHFNSKAGSNCAVMINVMLSVLIKLLTMKTQMLEIREIEIYGKSRHYLTKTCSLSPA